MTRIATTRQKDWLSVDCDRCSTSYSCLVEGVGQANNTLVPFSNKTLASVAAGNMRAEMRKKAQGKPCPTCGAYRQEHVDSLKRSKGRIVFWCTFLGTGFGTLYLSALVRMEILVLASPIVAWIMAKLMAQRAVATIKPNADLGLNLHLAKREISQGTMRLDPPITPTKAAPLRS